MKQGTFSFIDGDIVAGTGANGWVAVRENGRWNDSNGMKATDDESLSEFIDSGYHVFVGNRLDPDRREVSRGTLWEEGDIIADKNYNNVATFTGLDEFRDVHGTRYRPQEAHALVLQGHWVYLGNRKSL